MDPQKCGSYVINVKNKKSIFTLYLIVHQANSNMISCNRRRLRSKLEHIMPRLYVEPYFSLWENIIKWNIVKIYNISEQDLKEDIELDLFEEPPNYNKGSSTGVLRKKI
jgi:hypothetical protein